MPFVSALSFVGFLAALLWISMIADELVNLLRSVGKILRLSNAVLGLTVLAVGNSVPDLFANISLAKMGLPNMAVAACFGGPMLNIIMGIGVSTLYHNLTHGGGPYKVQVTPILISSATALTLGLLSSLILVPWNKWRGNASLGAYLIVLYVISMLINVTLEITLG
jgi:sodium/potassium/calcium exchanger 6